MWYRKLQSYHTLLFKGSFWWLFQNGVDLFICLFIYPMTFCIPMVIAQTSASRMRALAMAHSCLGDSSQKRLVALLSCCWGKEQL